MGSIVDTPWIGSVFDKVREVTEAGSREAPAHHSILRVPPLIRNLKPEHFGFEKIPLGLFNRDFINETSMDKVKLEVLGVFLEHLQLRDQEGWNAFRDEITVQPPHAPHASLENFYYDEIPREAFITPEMIKSVLTIDAVFIFAVFICKENFGEFFGNNEFRGHEKLRKIFSRGIRHNKFSDDIWLFENQIPMFLLKNIFQKIVNDRNKFNEFIKGVALDFAFRSALPSDIKSLEVDISLEHHHHLLACLRDIVCVPIVHRGPLSKLSYFYECVNRLARARSARKPDLGSASFTSKLIRPRKRGSLLFVSELRKVGIHVAGFPRNAGAIRFVPSKHRLTGTLYLPQLSFELSSAKIMLNLCIYEELTFLRMEPSFGGYLRILDDLVNTEEDVQLLQEGDHPVIVGVFVGDNKQLADTINNMRRNFAKGYFSREQKKVIQEILDWHRARWRHQVTHFIESYVTAPWILLSLLAGTIFLVATVMQIVYATLEYTNNH